MRSQVLQILAVIVFAFFTVLFVNCVDSPTCELGATSECVCLDGKSGSKTCSSSGVWTDCSCSTEQIAEKPAETKKEISPKEEVTGQSEPQRESFAAKEENIHEKKAHEEKPGNKELGKEKLSQRDEQQEVQDSGLTEITNPDESVVVETTRPDEPSKENMSSEEFEEVVETSENTSDGGSKELVSESTNENDTSCRDGDKRSCILANPGCKKDDNGSLKCIGECHLGENTCVGGKWSSVCQGRVAPVVEKCNGKDDDCDGDIDEDWSELGTQCEVGLGSCKRNGVEVCNSTGDGTRCNAVAPSGVRERCDGKDNDCDGEIDEDYPKLGLSCDIGLGVCASLGKFVCDTTGSKEVCDAKVITGTKEVCNGKDDDCNGKADDGIVGKACTKKFGECESKGSFVCQQGKMECSAQKPAGTKEVCNGKDDDCDGKVDEDFEPCKQLGDKKCKGKDQLICAQSGQCNVWKVEKTCTRKCDRGLCLDFSCKSDSDCSSAGSIYPLTCNGTHCDLACKSAPIETGPTGFSGGSYGGCKDSKTPIWGYSSKVLPDQSRCHFYIEDTKCIGSQICKQDIVTYQFICK